MGGGVDKMAAELQPLPDLPQETRLYSRQRMREGSHGSDLRLHAQHQVRIQRVGIGQQGKISIEQRTELPDNRDKEEVRRRMLRGIFESGWFDWGPSGAHLSQWIKRTLP